MKVKILMDGQLPEFAYYQASTGLKMGLFFFGHATQLAGDLSSLARD